jgi:hypothetical protein
VAVEDDLRAERRMPRHLDGHMPPYRVDDVKRIVIDVFAPPFDVDDAISRRPFHRPHRCRGLGHQHQKHPGVDRVSGQVFRGDAVLALAGLAEDHRDRVGRAPGLDPAGEPPGHPHQMGVVQLLVAAVVQPPPPMNLASLLASYG